MDRPEGERLSVIETKLDQLIENQKKYDTLRDEFIALKSRIGMVSAVIGIVFAAITTWVLSFFHAPGPHQ